MPANPNIFAFDSIPDRIANSTINLASGTFYAHLVSAIPASTISQVSGLTLISYTGYAPVAATSVSFVGGIWKMSDFLFPVNTGIAAIADSIGFVVCEQLGASPASTDNVVMFNRHRQGGVNVTIPIGANERIRAIVDQTNGILQTLAGTLFTSGSYVAPLDNNGTIYQLGTRNNAQAYVNPGASGTRIKFYQAVTSGLASSNTAVSAGLFGRTINAAAVNTAAALNIMEIIELQGSLLLRLTSASKIWLNYSASSASGLGIYGAKALPSFNATDVNNVNNWNLIGNITVASTGAASTFASINYSLTGVNDFYRYIGLYHTVATTINIAEIDFYNATLRSSTADLT
jgi:hypothetical protein